MFLILLGALVSTADETPICLVPERELGSRHPHHLVFKDIIWSADSRWFREPAPVCKVVTRPMDMSHIKSEAERWGMRPDKVDPSGNLIGKPGDGAFLYTNTDNGKFMGAAGNPRLRYFYFGLSTMDKFERDEHKMAVVKPLATREESVAICREWMRKLGVEEGEFSRQGDWPEGFEVKPMTGRVSRIHPVTKEKVIAHFGQDLRFVQQIGGLSAFWSGFGGNLMFSIGDGGEFCSVMGCLRAWEKIGDYPVLTREELDAALRDGFAWVQDPVECERMEIVHVDLDAYHSNWKSPQMHFPLIYSLHCKLHGGRDDGQQKTICLPALKQHRDRYGPRPELTEEDKNLQRMLNQKPTAKPVEEMTPEELEEFKRKWVESGGTVIPPPASKPGVAPPKRDALEP
jgi:hypothetical protein